jgi:hypothetical protein
MTHDNPENPDQPGVRRTAVPKSRKGVSLLRSRIGILLTTTTFAVLGLAGFFGYEVSTANATTSAATPTVGTIPASAISSGGMDTSQIPDFVPVIGQNGNVVGYIRKQDLFMQSTQSAGTGGAAGPTVQDEQNEAARATAPVYGPDLTTVVGHMEPNVGFVPLGSSPSQAPVTVTPTTISQQS